MQWGLFWFWNWILLTIVYHTWALIARKILNFVHIFYNFVYFLSRFVWYNRIKKWEDRIKKDVFHCNSMLNSIKILYAQKYNHLFRQWRYLVFGKMKSSSYHSLWENSVHVGIQTMKGALLWAKKKHT